MRALLAALAVLTACGRPPVPATPAASPAVTAAVVTATPAMTVTPSATPVPGVQAEPLGRLAGEWVFVLNAVPPVPDLGTEDHELWAVSADGRATRRVLRYRPVSGGPVNVLGPVTNNLARQLTKDGRTLLLAASATTGAGPYRIFSVDLERGAVSQLTSDAAFTDLEPMWAPDASTIAFARFSPERRERDLWVMRPDGTGQRALATNVGSLFGFSSDGQDVCYAQSSRYQCVEVSTGKLRELSGVVTIFRPIGSGVPSAWRAGTPAFAGSFNSPPRIEVADGIGVRQRTLAPSLFGDVRWRPGADEILAVTLRGDDWGELWRVGLDGTSRRVTTGLILRRAEWSPDGGSILGIAVEARAIPLPPAPAPATSLHRIDPERGTAVELFRPSRQATFGLFDVVSVIYR